MVLLLFFVADDTVESLISFTDHIKKEVMELKAANHLPASTDYLGK
jgi:hypothetical protein